MGVENTSVRNHENGLEHFFVQVVVQGGEAIAQPGDGVGFAAARRMLQQVVLPLAACLRVGNEFFHYVQLVIAWEDEKGFFLLDLLAVL